jgi:Fe-S-cluster containining protein
LLRVVVEIANVATESIARLRKELEVHYRSNGTVDVRDPKLLQIYTLDADDYRIAEHFDGSDLLELRDKLRKNGNPNISSARIREVRDELEELNLLDTPKARKAKPMVDNLQPYSQIDTKKALRVLPVADETANWTCHGCGICCHGLAVEITAEEERRIDASLYQDILHGEEFAENSFLNPDEPAKRTLRQDEDRNNACIFLAPNGLCYVHARQGMHAKPDACQMFPAMVLRVPNGPPRLGVRTNCASMYKSYDTGPAVSELVPHIMRVLEKGEYHAAPKKVRYFKRSVAFDKMDQALVRARAIFDEEGLNARAIMKIDRELLGGRVKKAQKKYGRLMLEYLEKEATGPAPVEEGAYRMQIKRVRRGREALHAMSLGRMPQDPSAKVEAFLRAQISHVLYIAGPLNLPDAGYAFVGLMLGMLAVLHAVSETGSLKTANTAFEVFMMPLLETMEHSWPILDAIDKPYATALRKEL